MKPYQQIPIEDCGEPLVPIPLEKFAVELPHPYEKLGANYGGRSPYYLRQGIVEALLQAQYQLQQLRSGWRIKIFDAYRPLTIQQFMVDYSFAFLLKQREIMPENLTPEMGKECWQEVYKIWAIPSENPATPPPHSTGAAVDITLVDAEGNTLDMGGEIDELSPRSQPDFYAKSNEPQAAEYQARRQLLNEVMTSAEFRRHLGEWWHFSRGDQMWAWQEQQANPAGKFIARYGRI
jgi:D-alanyl-D-alanine dipeptidase